MEIGDRYIANHLNYELFSVGVGGGIMRAHVVEVEFTGFMGITVHHYGKESRVASSQLRVMGFQTGELIV